MRIVIDSNIPYIAGAFERFCDVGYFSAKEIVRDVVKDVDVLIVRTRTKCDENLLKGSKVRLIATATIGFDHIDLSYCQKEGIGIVSCAGCNAVAVMQWVFAAMRELRCEGVLGIVGVGNVGSEVEKMATQRGISVLRCDPPRAEREGKDGFVELDELLERSDIVTMHVPKNKETEGMCNETFFSKFKGGVFLNASRGEVVDEEALKRAIKSGQVAKCALDVWQNEPNIDRELLEMVDIATPHIAGYSIRGKANATRMVVNEVAKRFGIDELINWMPDVEVKLEDPEKYSIFEDDKALRGEVDFEQLRTNYNYR